MSANGSIAAKGTTPNMKPAVEATAWAISSSMLPFGLIVVGDWGCLISGSGFGGGVIGFCSSLFAGLTIVSAGAVGTTSLGIRRLWFSAQGPRMNLIAETIAWAIAVSLVLVGVVFPGAFQCLWSGAGRSPPLLICLSTIVWLGFVSAGVVVMTMLAIRRLFFFLRHRKAATPEPRA